MNREYAVGTQCLNNPKGSVRILATFATMEDAIIFMKGYMQEYCKEPELRLVLIAKWHGRE